MSTVSFKNVNKIYDNNVQAVFDFNLDVKDDALDCIANAGYDPYFGARPLKREIIKSIETPLSHMLLSGSILPDSIIQITSDANDKINFSIKVRLTFIFISGFFNFI